MELREPGAQERNQRSEVRGWKEEGKKIEQENRRR